MNFLALSFGGLTWLTPGTAALAAAIAVPTLVILYFLKLRRRDVEVSTTLLWRKAIQDMQANAPFQKLRRNILLLLQLLVLAGILLALGQPQIKGQTVVGGKHVIMIDRSGSMNALDESDGKGGTRTRLEAAKEKAIAFVQSMRETDLFSRAGVTDEAMVIAFDASADIRQPFTGDKRALVEAIKAIEPTDNPTRVREAVRLAMAHKPRRVDEGVGLVVGPPVRLHIYSDGRIPDAEEAQPDSDDQIEYHKVGAASSTNVGIISIRAERSFENPTNLSVFVALQNSKPEPQTVDVELLIDGIVQRIKSTTVGAATREVAALSVPAAARERADLTEAAAALGADGTALDPRLTPTPRRLMAPGVGGVVFQMDRGEGGAVQARVRAPGMAETLADDVLALDDRAWMVVPPAKRLAVAVIGEPDVFIPSVLSGLPLSRLVEMTGAQYEEAKRGNRLGAFDVLVFRNWLPAVMPTGRALVIGGVPPGVGITDKGKGGAAGVVDWRRDHPVLRAVNLSEMTVGESRVVEVEPGSGPSVLASSDSGPIILESVTADSRMIVVPFDIGASDWPFKPSYVVFLVSAVTYLGEDGNVGVTNRLIQPGSVLSDRIPPEARNVSVRLPGGENRALTPSADGRIVFGPLLRTGLYEVSWDGPAGTTDFTAAGSGRVVRTYASNLLDAAESDVASSETLAMATKVVRADGDTSAQADRKLWPWLLAVALAVMMLEWFIYNRKVHV